jgi:myo-inositol-1(or 4)-monophosphatase
MSKLISPATAHNSVEDVAVDEELFAFVRRLADESAALIRRYFRKDYRIDYKEDESPVTIADRGAEEIMRSAIMQAYPEHGIVGEEFGLHRPEARYQWVLDPIDGTKAFVSGSYLFGTLIALLEDGRPILGAIHHPMMDDHLVGDGRRTWLNGERVHVRPCERVEDAILLNTSHWNVQNYHNGAAFEALSRRVGRYNNWGDCHGYYLVATGGADIMTDPVLNDWDLMALIPVIEGAGGRITDWRGNDVIGGDGAIATAGGPLHDAVVRLLNP